MGCSTSKLDDEEAVQLCKDRKNFIKQAVEHRMRFASYHISYVQSLKRVSAALKDYIEGDEPREFTLDAFTTPPFTPIKKSTTGFISISPSSFPVKPIQSTTNTTVKVNYLRSGGNTSVSVEERPQSPETVRIETYSPIHQYGMDSFFSMQSPPMNSSIFSYSPNNRPTLPPPSPQNSQWDLFWNPFSSLDYYGYPTRSSLDSTVLDDEINGLRQVREEEGIPELEEETEQEDVDHNMKDERAHVNVNCSKDEVLVEDDDDDDDHDCDSIEDDDEYETDNGNGSEHEVEGSPKSKHEVKKFSENTRSLDVSKAQSVGRQVSMKEAGFGGDLEANEETPGFTVYVNRRPTSMTEVIKDLETQFTIICNSANEVSALLEASRAQYSSTSNELTGLITQIIYSTYLKSVPLTTTTIQVQKMYIY